MDDGAPVHFATINGSSPSGIVARTVKGGVAITSLSGKSLLVEVVAANAVIIRPAIGGEIAPGIIIR